MQFKPWSVDLVTRIIDGGVRSCDQWPYWFLETRNILRKVHSQKTEFHVRLNMAAVMAIAQNVCGNCLSSVLARSFQTGNQNARTVKGLDCQIRKAIRNVELHSKFLHFLCIVIVV